MADLADAERRWHEWIADACRAVDVDPSDVDVPGIHDLTKEIAHGFARPMAPVGSFILGLAIGARSAQGRPADPEALARAIRETFPGAAAAAGAGGGGVNRRRGAARSSARSSATSAP